MPFFGILICYTNTHFMPALNPSTSPAVAYPYGVKNLDQKLKNKAALQEEFGWPEEPKRAMVCLPLGMTDALGGALLKEALPGILAMPVELVIVGKGSKEYGSLFTDIAKKHSHRVRIVQDTPEMLAKMYAAADMAYFFADPTSQPQLQECLTFGVVPIAPKTSALDTYDPVQETGNSFLYDEANVWHVFGGLVRALETYKFPFDWRTIQRHCLESAGNM